MDSSALLTELPRLRRYARALVGDRAAADDLVQDTLAKGMPARLNLQTADGLRRVYLRPAGQGSAPAKKP